MSAPYKLLRAPWKTLGISHSTFYEWVGKGLVSRGITIDPNGRARAWPEAEIAGLVEGAIARRDAEDAERRQADQRRTPADQAVA
jgi:predicted DNA-binding transcriptional regulator AlpA